MLKNYNNMVTVIIANDLDISNIKSALNRYA